MENKIDKDFAQIAAQVIAATFIPGRGIDDNLATARAFVSLVKEVSTIQQVGIANSTKKPVKK
jgi:hypothetical protein